MKIFISYTTRDDTITKELLRQFERFLSVSNIVFIDLLHNDSKNKQERIFREIDSSDKLILIETKNVYDSNWVQLELERAKLKNINVVRISSDDLFNINSENLE